VLAFFQRVITLGITNRASLASQTRSNAVAFSAMVSTRSETVALFFVQQQSCVWLRKIAHKGVTHAARKHLLPAAENLDDASCPELIEKMRPAIKLNGQIIIVRKPPLWNHTQKERHGYLRAIFFRFPNASQFGTILSMTPLLLGEQFWRFWRIARGRTGACRPAAFSGYFPLWRQK